MIRKTQALNTMLVFLVIALSPIVNATDLLFMGGATYVSPNGGIKLMTTGSPGYVTLTVAGIFSNAVLKLKKVREYDDGVEYVGVAVPVSQWGPYFTEYVEKVSGLAIKLKAENLNTSNMKMANGVGLNGKFLWVQPKQVSLEIPIHNPLLAGEPHSYLVELSLTHPGDF